IFYRHFQHFVDVLAFVFNFQRLTIVAFAFTDIARYVDIRQKVHLNFGHSVALAGFTASAFNVETEAAWLISARPSFLSAREKIPYRGKYPGISGWVGARCSSNRTLVDIHAFIKELKARYRFVRRGIQSACTTKCRRSQGEQRSVDQRTLAGTGHAGYTVNQADGIFCSYFLQVIAGGSI